MKLLLLTQTVDESDPILGFMVGWILELSKSFKEVHVICLQLGTHTLPSHIHVHSLGKESGANRLKYLWRFYRYFSTHVRETEYVFFHMGAVMNILAIPFFILSRFGGPTFMWWKAHGRINWVGRLASLFTDQVLTSTASGFPIDIQKRRIIGQAIDTTRFTFDPAAARKEKHVIFVGRIMPIKQLEVFIEVARQMEPRRYTFSIVGPVGDEAYYAGLQQSAADTNIEWVGPRSQSELVSVYQQSGVFLNTSLTHSMDKTVLEAILCGCIPLTANRAFRGLLGPHGLYTEQATVEQYVTMISGISTMPKAALRATLQSEVTKAHSLNTFSDRVFSHYVTPYETNDETHT